MISENLAYITIVDEDAMAALVTQRGLQARLGALVEVRVAASPQSAWLQCVQGRVDLLIIDPHPRTRAPQELLQAIRSTYPHIRVIVLTAYDTPRLRAETRAVGTHGYFAKPVELMYLEQGVRVVLDAQTGHDI